RRWDCCCAGTSGSAPGSFSTTGVRSPSRSESLDMLPSPMLARPFVYAAPGEIRFGWGEAAALPAAAARFGRRPLLVTGSALRRSGRLAPLVESLRSVGVQPALHEGVPPEPTLEALQRAMDACVAAGADSVIALGGGSVLDIGK